MYTGAGLATFAGQWRFYYQDSLRPALYETQSTLGGPWTTSYLLCLMGLRRPAAKVSTEPSNMI